MRILFLHGFMGSGQDWQTLIEYLWPLNRTSSLEILTPDLPGFGKTPLPHHNRQELYQELGALWSQWKADIVVAYSLGGRVALELSLLHNTPQILILESAGPGLEKEGDRKKRLELDKERAQELKKNRPSFLKKWWQAPLFGNLIKHPAYPSLLHSRLVDPGTNWAKAVELYSPGHMPNLWPVLTQIKGTQVYYFHGENDPIYHQYSKKLQRQNLKNWHFKKFSGVGHNIHFESPEKLAEQIRPIFQSLGT